MTPELTKAFVPPAIEADFRGDIVKAIEAMPASQLIGLKVLGFAADGVSLLQLPMRAELTFDGRVAHGGVVGMLADYAGVSAANCALPLGWIALTTGYEVHNLAPAVGDALVAVGRVIKMGKTIAVSGAEVWARRDGLHTLVAWATTTCKPLKIMP
jgi:uncharacterized protein (TIGR00369 family)